MKTIKITLAALAVASLVIASGSASADRGHYHGSRLHFGINLGVPLWYPGPYYYPYPAYSYPAPVVVQPAPRVYVEREDALVLQDTPAARSSSPYWYYCRESNMYYPYARECAGPWERVPARPASAR